MNVRRASVAQLYQYPVKGLSGEMLASIRFSTDEGMGLDRRWALLLPGIDFDERNPAPLPKTKFLTLARQERLASVRTQLVGHTLLVEDEFGATIAGDLSTKRGRYAIEDFFGRLVGGATSHRPRIVSSDGHRFTDVSVVSPAMMRAVSLINLESVRAPSALAGIPIDPLRFRANIYVERMPAWKEAELVGSEILIGGFAFRVVARTRRCAAI